MNAVISGRNAVALLLDGDRLASIHADAIDQLVPRQPADLPFLFGDGYDLQFLENVTSQDVAYHLELARDGDQAMQLALILLDSELSDEVRQEATAALDELLAHDYVFHYLQCLLYAHPLPESADLKGAFECCEHISARLVQNLLDTVNKLQPQIREVRFAWDGIPNATFGSNETRAHCQAVATHEGFFRDLVTKIANGETLDTFLANSLQNSVANILPELREALGAMVGILATRPTTLPLTPDQTVEAKREAAETKKVEALESIEIKYGPSEIDNEWIASRQDAVRYYLWKKWNLRGDDLEEVLQETLAAALQSFVNYEGRKNAELGTYLIGIARNVVHSYFRRLNRHERRQVPIELTEHLEVVFKDEAEAKDLATSLKGIIAKLPKKYIQVMELIFYQDYREGEAAKVLGIPADRVYSIKSDALKRLRNLFRKDLKVEAFLDIRSKPFPCPYSNHPDFIAAYVRGELTEIDKEKFEAHYLSCEECRRTLRFFEKTTRTIRHYGDIIFPQVKGSPRMTSFDSRRNRKS